VARLARAATLRLALHPDDRPAKFYLERERKRLYRASRRELINTHVRRRRAADPDFRDGARARRYGLSLEEYRAMLRRQGDACGICRKHRPLFIDHCHDAHYVRRLLCRKCNTGIGCFDDDPALLRAAADYIEEMRREHEARRKDQQKRDAEAAGPAPEGEGGEEATKRPPDRRTDEG
jgi:hypothetical protein